MYIILQNIFRIPVNKSNDIDNIHRIHLNFHHHNIHLEPQIDHHKLKCIDYLNLIDIHIDRINKLLECNFHIILSKKIDRDHSHHIELDCRHHITLIPLLSNYHRSVHMI